VNATPTSALQISSRKLDGKTNILHVRLGNLDAQAPYTPLPCLEDSARDSTRRRELLEEKNQKVKMAVGSTVNTAASLGVGGVGVGPVGAGVAGVLGVGASVEGMTDLETDEILESTDMKSEFGLRENVHPAEIQVSRNHEFAIHLVQSGFLMARKLGSLPMISLLSPEQQSRITLASLQNLTSVGNAGTVLICKEQNETFYKAAAGCLKGLEEEELSPSSASSLATPGPDNDDNLTAGACYALASARSSHRVAALAGFVPERSPGHLLTHLGPRVYLVLATCVEPFAVFIMLVVLFTGTALATAELVNVYRTRCAGVLIVFVNTCISLAFLAKSAGKEFLLARREFNEL